MFYSSLSGDRPGTNARLLICPLGLCVLGLSGPRNGTIQVGKRRWDTAMQQEGLA